MAKVYLAIDTKQKDFEQTLLNHALNGKEGWIFMHVHPRVAKLLEAMEEADFGDVSFDLRHGLPENIRVARLLPKES